MQTVSHFYLRAKGYLSRRLETPRRLSLREAVSVAANRQAGARWLADPTAAGSRAAFIPGLKIATVRDEWKNAFHAVFTANGCNIELHAAKCTPAHCERLATASPARLSEGIWIAEDWQGNYYHWLVRHLPKLVLFEREDTNAPLVLPATCGMRAVIDQSLDALGWPADRRVYVDADVTAFDRGYVAQLAGIDAELIRQVSNRLRLPPTSGESEIVFASRAAAGTRRILDERTLTDGLQALGVRPIQFEGLSFDDQRRAMRNAKTLVGTHGAGLTNMLFMPAGGTVIEIIASHAVSGSLFRTLAESLGHTYVHVPADRVSPHEGNNSDIRVDPLLVASALGRSPELPS
jgi:capsular polysaccharide biosynthesis protein